MWILDSSREDDVSLLSLMLSCQQGALCCSVLCWSCSPFILCLLIQHLNHHLHGSSLHNVSPVSWSNELQPHLLLQPSILLLLHLLILLLLLLLFYLCPLFFHFPSSSPSSPPPPLPSPAPLLSLSPSPPPPPSPETLDKYSWLQPEGAVTCTRRQPASLPASCCQNSPRSFTAVRKNAHLELK